MGEPFGSLRVYSLTDTDSFGAIHDCTSGCSLSGPCSPFTTTTCNANGRHIMNPTTSSTEHFFSGCTVGNVCNNVGNRRISTSCIQTPGVRTVISLQQCGSELFRSFNSGPD